MEANCHQINMIGPRSVECSRLICLFSGQGFWFFTGFGLQSVVLVPQRLFRPLITRLKERLVVQDLETKRTTTNLDWP